MDKRTFLSRENQVASNGTTNRRSEKGLLITDESISSHGLAYKIEDILCSVLTQNVINCYSA